MTAVLPDGWTVGTDQPAEPPDIVGECYRCGDDVLADSEYRLYGGDDDDDCDAGEPICEDCIDYYYACGGRCDTLVSELLQAEDQSYTAHDMCRRCAMAAGWSQCEGCDRWYAYGLYRGDQCAGCFECDCGECGCDDCYPDGCPCSDCSDGADADTDGIHDYSFRPVPSFFDRRDESYGSWEPLPGTPYLGLELEISVPRAHVARAARLLRDAQEDLLYLKSDSSISSGGFEMVTHPMALDVARELLPFETLHTLRNDYGASGYGNGIHVHVSRDGFTSASHAFRWMKLIYRNELSVKRIARRSSSEWAPFSHHERGVQKHTCKPVRNRSDACRWSVTRYSAINTTNVTTFEVRVFRGSLRKDEILAALELVHASVEYTRQLTPRAIIAGDGWSWAAFIEWARGQGETYCHLVAANDTGATADL